MSVKTTPTLLNPVVKIPKLTVSVQSPFSICFAILKSGVRETFVFEDFPKMTVFGEMINWGKSFG